LVIECVSYDLSRIVKITETELIYQEDRGDLISINLQMCRNRYLKYINSHLDDFPSRKGIPIDDGSDFKCVADRFFDGLSNPYFEFYDWPHIKFEMQMKKSFWSRFLNVDWMELDCKIL